jgi:hypothetical protein
VSDTGQAAILTTAGAVIGWAIAYILKGWREDRTTRLQIELDHASAQMKEFYAPLVALTDQLNTTAAIKETVTSGKTPEDQHALTELIYFSFFLPIHEEINAILKTKIHLLEGRTTPRSFDDYFEHFTTEKAYWNLRKAGKDVSNIQVPDYPSRFYHDVRKDHAKVVARYEDTLEELRERRWFFGFGRLLTSSSKVQKPSATGRRGAVAKTQKSPS